MHSLYSPLPPSPLPLTNEKLGEMDPTVLAGLYYGLQHAAHMQPSPCSTVARSFPPLKADGESATLLDFTLRKTVENWLFLKILILIRYLSFIYDCKVMPNMTKTYKKRIFK